MTANPVIRDFIWVATPENEPKDYSPTPVDEILISFFESETMPDVKELARLLRRGDLLPAAAGALLAEILDCSRHFKPACNWQLEARWAGNQKKELILDKVVAAVQKRDTLEEYYKNDLPQMMGITKRSFQPKQGPEVKARREALAQRAEIARKFSAKS